MGLLGPLSLLSQPASPESIAFDHWESVQEEENRKEQGREAESLCVSYKACVVNRSGAIEEGEGVQREEVGVNLTCDTRGSLRPL